jgi:hypothetical protein
MILAILLSFSFIAPNDYKIIWLSNLSTLGVPDEGYTRHVSVMSNKFDIYVFISDTL